MIIELCNLPQGIQCLVLELAGGWGFQRKLRTLGIREGKPIRVVASQPFGGPLVVDLEGRKVTIGRRMAQRIRVETGE